MVDELPLPPMTTPVVPGVRERRTRLARRPRPVPPSAWALPDAECADADGVVGVGADLLPGTLVDAYVRGIFPWPHPGVPLPWCSPDPRGVLLPGDVHVSRSLARTLRRCGWRSTVDTAFASVIDACATAPGREPTWIVPRMRDAYLRLHELGWAHSLEIWDGGTLVGGLYGVQVGGIFTGESMFHRVSDASKVAMIDLIDRFVGAGGDYLDVQIATAHLRSLGVTTMPRQAFVADLERARGRDVRLVVDPLEVDRLVAWRD